MKYGKLFFVSAAGFLTLSSLQAGYDPTLGRWLDRDPIDNAELRQGTNLYAYVRDGPINRVDPDGRDIWVGGPPWSPHENINVGTPGHVLGSYTFGVDLMHAFTWRYGLTGTIYDDFRSTTPKSYTLYLLTTPDEDLRALAILNALVGERAPYRLTNSSCRSFSIDMFNFFRDLFGPPDATPVPLPGPLR